MAYNQRGLDSNQEQSQKNILRDTRVLSMRIADFLKNPQGVALFLLTCAVSTLILGYLSEIIFCVGVGSFYYCFTRKAALPFRLPARARQPDINDMAPGSNKPRMSRGIYFFGNENKTM